MHPSLSRPLRLSRLRAVTAVSAVLLLGLCGCQTDGLSDITGSLGDKADKAAPAKSLEFYQERHRANPDDAEAALNYGKALRATGQRSQAVAVLEQATIAHPADKALENGLELLKNRQYGQALRYLRQAEDIVKGLVSPCYIGVAYLEMGHNSEALDAFQRGLEIYDHRHDYYKHSLAHLSVVYKKIGSKEQSSKFAKRFLEHVNV